MSPVNEPQKQHDVPKTYLRRFAIDPNDRKLRNMVYCFWTNQYESKTEDTSVDSNKFKKPNFYTIDDSNEPYVLELFFKKRIEPLYNKIMKEVEREENLSLACRKRLNHWLYYNKYRNKSNRDNLERIINSSFNIISKLRNIELSKEEIRSAASPTAKRIQLDSLIDDDLATKFEIGMGVKHWMLLKSKSKNNFLTNDNPGFSINVEMSVPDMNSLSSSFATNSKAWNYFVLSPKYCLLISTFWEGALKEISIQEIEFKVTSDKHIDFINSCTTITRTNY